MMIWVRFALLVGWWLGLCGAASVSRGEAPGEVDFARDVRPILAQHCFKCHGPDDKTREAGLRLDARDSALRPAESGERAIVPGKPEESELLRRIESADEEVVMPPPAAKKPLSEAQKQALRRWIEGGAKYQQHWAFVAPRQATVPKVKRGDWPKNAIDYFVLSRLEAAGLEPAPAADRYTLVRRLYLDLIGLPPTPEEADRFVQDKSERAYEVLVEQLLASPHYGERWARRWLDLARYADTNGYEKDRVRSMWPYRDWVIEAFNRDLPFDQFTIAQIAGDMLPKASAADRIATGFHRNTMLNEEGGIDPLEFRFHAMTDRMATTGTVWLGMTLGCAQCHTHKYDPISQTEYYRLMALLNNADEPTMDVPRPEIAKRREEIERQIAELTASLPSRFPMEEVEWQTVAKSTFAAESGATGETLADGSVRVGGTLAETDAYTLTFESDAVGVNSLRLEALADPALPSEGPGRTPHGNFVVTEVVVSVAPKGKPSEAQPVKITAATADFAQDQFPPAHMVDGKDQTGWAIHGPGKWNVNRAAVLQFERPVGFAGGPGFVGGTVWTVKVEQRYGGKHTLGRMRASLGRSVAADAATVEARRRERLEKRFAEWQAEQSQRAAQWNTLVPVSAKGNVPILEVQSDGSILARGDSSKRDVYDVSYRGPRAPITSLRLEVLPDASLPRGGPGRVSYEGPFGDFFLSSLRVTADGQPVKLVRATHSYAGGGSNAANILDDDPQTGWGIDGGQGRAHRVVFNLAEPLASAEQIDVQLICERYHAAGLGRFRVSVTSDTRPLAANDLPTEIEEILGLPAAERTPPQQERLLAHFVSVAPELAAEQAKIRELKQSLPTYPTTLVMRERPVEHTRPTFVHRRGEYLQPTEQVEPGVPAYLPGLPEGGERDRLALARWLVDPRHPLTSRVVMNRQWGAFFGRAIVRTVEDFGFQGEAPSHPELLDWLAVELIQQHWSQKQMHRLIVNSATYQQSSQATSEKLEKDPQNRLLSRGPRVRLEGELVRDAALRISGLLSEKIGGPSVFPPQPPGVSSEGAYGPLEWKVSEGADRYRRGLYTFAKRTAPYAMFSTFDAPSGEACVARREASNTPLQALTMLNDSVLIDAAQALGRQLAAREGSVEARMEWLFRRCVTRPPRADELALLIRFQEGQRKRLEAKELDAATLAGPGEGDALERAVWTVTARAALNLDETITKE